MQSVTHICGQPLERGAGPQGLYFQAIPVNETRERYEDVNSCPRCHEALCDTDLLDSSGSPLAVLNPTAWSINRRAALAAIVANGYSYCYEDDYWRLRHADLGYDLMWSDNLDALVELATLMAAGRMPIRLYWVFLHGGVESIWAGLYDESIGKAVGRADGNALETVSIMIRGNDAILERPGINRAQRGRLWSRSSRLIELQFLAE